jgi:AraC family transcriptional regulator, transcriptional activator of pobA
MQPIETLEEFYQRHPVDNQKVFAENNTGQGHFNVFLRKPCIHRTPFTRRDFYKVALVIGNGKMIYADKQVAIDRPALLFSSPSVTSSWESGPGPQSGWFCLFTQAFIDSYEHKSTLQDFPLFKTGGSHIVFLDGSQLSFLSATLTKMMEEMDSDYVNKYDLLRNYLRIIMHEALKIAPVSTYDTNTSAAARITTQFLELLERQFPIDSPEQSLKLKTANEYAQALAVHTNHLNRSVKEVTGKTTTQHISERVLKEANALLKHTDWSIAQVASGLGFDEPAYFTNFFKKYNGSSPANARIGAV